MGMSKEISLQQFFFLTKKIRGYNIVTDDLTIETSEYDHATIIGAQYTTPTAAINIRWYRNDSKIKISIAVPNTRVKVERLIDVIDFPPFRMFNPYYLVWMLLKLKLKKIGRAEWLEKENFKLTEVSRVIDTAFPEEVEKQLLGK
jgi:hypothetical protein